MIAQTIVHYACHFVVPALWAWLFFGRERWLRAYVIMLLTMLVDLDHLLADPIFDPNRMSIGFHYLHRYPMIVLYALMCFVPYERLGLSWQWRAVGIGLIFHMITDYQDYVLWH